MIGVSLQLYLKPPPRGEDGGILTLFQHQCWCVLVKLRPTGFEYLFSPSTEKWDNVFSTRIRIINASEGSVTITAVSGEYLSHSELVLPYSMDRQCTVLCLLAFPLGGEWIRCDDTLVTKDFFPGMYKWSFSTKNYVSLAPGFEDTLNTNLSISFPGECTCLRVTAWHCI